MKNTLLGKAMVLGALIGSLFLGFVSQQASAATDTAQGLVIHASEFGVGKFHRYDNKVHAYGANHAWGAFVMADNTPTDKAQVIDNADGSVTIFYSTLDELIANSMSIAKTRGEKIQVLNVHGHGLPGAMWFPSTDKILNSKECASWRAAVKGSDEGNYDQYYTPVEEMEIMQIRSISDSLNFHMGCTTGYPEWKNAVAQTPDFKASFADNAQIHFLSCVVGLGKAGDRFVKGIAELLLPGDQGRVEASTYFGLGDWSMPEGMGFWDFQSESQLQHDNEIYPKDKTDREIMQKGVIRASVKSAKGWETSLLAGRDFMTVGFTSALMGYPVNESPVINKVSVPSRIRIPGTRFVVEVTK